MRKRCRAARCPVFVFGDVAPAGSMATDPVVATAVEGVRGAGDALPHLDAIQASFGSHDMRGVVCRVGGAGAAAATAIGARAYAVGHRVAFASAPDLRTTAHEAAPGAIERSLSSCRRSRTWFTSSRRTIRRVSKRTGTAASLRNERTAHGSPLPSMTFGRSNVAAQCRDPRRSRPELSVDDAHQLRLRARDLDQMGRKKMRFVHSAASVACQISIRSSAAAAGGMCCGTMMRPGLDWASMKRAKWDGIAV